MIKLSYASNVNYSEAIIGLRNRALLVGGNAISVVGWARSATSSGLVVKLSMQEKAVPYSLLEKTVLMLVNAKPFNIGAALVDFFTVRLKFLNHIFRAHPFV